MILSHFGAKGKCERERACGTENQEPPMVFMGGMMSEISRNYFLNKLSLFALILLLKLHIEIGLFVNPMCK